MENKMTPKQALEKLVAYILIDEEKGYMDITEGNIVRKDKQIIEQALTEHEKLKEVLENLQTSRDKVKIPLSAILEGLSQEEKYTLIEHIYYSQAPWQEKYQDLQVLYKNQTHNNEMLQEENQELKKVLNIIKEKIMPLVILYDDCVSDNEDYESKELTPEECDLLERWLDK